jgi:single-strand DNA-binding protein
LPEIVEDESMASFNKVILAGNLTKDPELRYTPKGTAIAKLALAVNRRWTGEDGQQREEVTYVDIDAFGKQAETISQYLKKGGGILIEGRLRLDQWDDKQTGQKRSRLGVVLEGFTFLGTGRAEGGIAPAAGGAPAPRPQSRPQPPARSESAAPETDGPPPEDDDVPF